MFAVLVVAIVVGIGVVLTSESWLSIQKFGLGFWQTTTWDPVAGDFGALPFIWGTLYSSILALLIATPVALGIAVFIAELCPAWLRMPLVFLTELLAAIPSIVYGLWASSSWCPLSGSSRSPRRSSSRRFRSSADRRSASACCRPV